MRQLYCDRRLLSQKRQMRGLVSAVKLKKLGYKKEDHSLYRRQRIQWLKLIQVIDKVMKQAVVVVRTKGCNCVFGTVVPVARLGIIYVPVKKQQRPLRKRTYIVAINFKVLQLNNNQFCNRSQEKQSTRLFSRLTIYVYQSIFFYYYIRSRQTK